MKFLKSPHPRPEARVVYREGQGFFVELDAGGVKLRRHYGSRTQAVFEANSLNKRLRATKSS